MDVIFLALLAWMGAGRALPAVENSPNLVRLCTSTAGCSDLLASELDPTLRPQPTTGSIAFVDEAGRLMEPTDEQIRDFRDLVFEERWVEDLATPQETTLPDGTHVLTFPEGFLIGLTVRLAPAAESRSAVQNGGKP